MSDLYPARQLTAEDLGVPLPVSETQAIVPDTATPPIDSQDPFVLKVRRLLHQFGGVILSGVPGTSKSWWAQRIAEVLTDDESHRDFVQFHPSYQYEDFIYGYVPDPDGDEGVSFKGRKAIFLEACAKADEIAPKPFVLVIDEFSRADVGRVFGEALTYIEDTKRGFPFKIAAGLEVTVPKNLLILATMNPFDRGVDEVDAAFERRFAKVAMEPKREELEEFLDGLDPDIIRKVSGWFNFMNHQKDTPLAAVGHAYFKSVSDIDSLREVWEYQLQFHVERAFRMNAEGYSAAVENWKRIFDGVSGGWDGNTEPSVASETDDQPSEPEVE